MEKLVCILAYQPRGRRKGVVIVGSTDDRKVIRQVASAALSELQRVASVETAAVVNSLRMDEAEVSGAGGPVVVCSRERSAAILQSATAGLT